MKAKVKATIAPNPSDCRFETDAGTPIHGVVAATITCAVGKPSRIALDLLCEGSVHGVGSYLVADPATGEMKPVRRIEFADGSAFEAG